MVGSSRIGADESINDHAGKTEEEINELLADKVGYWFLKKQKQKKTYKIYILHLLRGKYQNWNKEGRNLGRIIKKNGLEMGEKSNLT